MGVGKLPCTMTCLLPQALNAIATMTALNHFVHVLAFKVIESNKRATVSVG